MRVVLGEEQECRSDERLCMYKDRLCTNSEESK